MDLISDSLLFAATIGAAIYCYVLAGRLRRFTTLESGMGGAIAVLSAQVDDMTRALDKAQGVATTSERRLVELTDRAEGLARQLELMVASLHDLPATPEGTKDAMPSAVEETRKLRFIRRRSVRPLVEAAE